MEQNKPKNLLSLCRKAGKLTLGEELIAADCRAGHTRLLVLAADTAEGTARKIAALSKGGTPPILRCPLTRDEIGDAVGRPSCAAAAITDAGLAQAFVKALGRDEDAAILAELDRRVQRVQKRRQEEQNHKRNLRRGKK